MHKTLFVSMVGGGYGGRLSLTALKDSPRFRLVAAADLREDVRRELETEYPGLLNAGIHWLDFCLAATGETDGRGLPEIPV